VNCLRQLTKRSGARAIESAGFEAAPGALESEAQGHVFVGVAQRTQQPPHFVRAAAGGADGLQRGRHSGFTCGDRLEQRTFKLPATRRSLVVDAAAIVGAERGAGLRESWRAALRVRRDYNPVLLTNLSTVTDGQPKELEVCRIFAGLDFDVLEENAIAAQAAGEAKLLRQGSWRSHRLIVTVGSLGVSGQWSNHGLPMNSLKSSGVGTNLATH
jgi:hypothetical protein